MDNSKIQTPPRPQQQIISARNIMVHNIERRERTVEKYLFMHDISEIWVEYDTGSKIYIGF